MLVCCTADHVPDHVPVPDGSHGAQYRIRCCDGCTVSCLTVAFGYKQHQFVLYIWPEVQCVDFILWDLVAV